MSGASGIGGAGAASAARGATVASPRWYAHPYNRAGFYRAAALLAGVPRPARLRLVRALGRVAPPLFPVERAVVRRTLGRITGAEGRELDRLTVDVFRNFAACFSDLVSTNRRPAPRLLPEVAAITGADAVTGLTGGVVSLTAHVGNWELAGRLLAHGAARRTHVVVAVEEAPGLERWVRRNGDGVRFVPRAAPTVAVELVAALRRGEVVAVQGDRALGTRGDVVVPFFGAPARFPLGPFLLARAAGVPVVPAFCVLRRDGRYDMTVLPPRRVERGEEAAAARDWVAALERAVRRHPTQWFNFYDVWGAPASVGEPA